MAHHQDGSSVQQHSAGSHYPFVVGVQEFTDGPVPATGYAYVQDPSGLEHGCYSYEIADKNARLDAYAKAFVLADRLAKALREVQAWAKAHAQDVASYSKTLPAKGWHAQVLADGDAGLEDFA